MFDITFISDFSRGIRKLSDSVTLYGHYFKALALVDAYNLLISYADERMNGHPEVARMPELRDVLLKHLYDNPHKHIDLATNRIFNHILLGTESTVRQWQNAGYPMNRTPGNYGKRYLYWQSIYTGQPVKVPIARSKKKTSPKPRTGKDIFSSDPHYTQQALYYEVQVKDRSGSIVTYEDVIQKRNTRFGVNPNGLIPYWVVLNYGSDRGSQPGFPATPGLHFVEDAEREVPSKLSLYAHLFERFMVDSLDMIEDISDNDFTHVDTWAKSNVNLNKGGVNPFDFALEASFGLPF
jgi:hypothetical protein